MPSQQDIQEALKAVNSDATLSPSERSAYIEKIRGVALKSPETASQSQAPSSALPADDPIAATLQKPQAKQPDQPIDIGGAVGGFFKGLGRGVTADYYSPKLSPAEQGGAYWGDTLGSLGTNIALGAGGAALGSLLPGAGTVAGAAAGPAAYAALREANEEHGAGKDYNPLAIGGQALVGGAMGAIAPGEGSLITKGLKGAAIGGLGAGAGDVISQYFNNNGKVMLPEVLQQAGQGAMIGGLLPAGERFLLGRGANLLKGSGNAGAEQTPISVTGLRGLNNNAGQSSGISTNGNAVVVDNTGSNGNNNGNQDSFLSDEQQDELKSDPITGQPTAPPHTETVSGQIVNEPQQDAPQPAQWFGGRIGQPAPETAAPQPEPATNNKQVQLDQIAHMAASHPDPTIRARYQQVLDQYNQNNQPQETLQQPQSWHKMSPELQAIIQKRQQAAQTPESATGGNPEPQEAPPWEQESTEPESHQEQEEQPQNTAEQQAEILKQQQEAQEAQRQAAIEQQGEALHKHLTNAEKLNPSKKTIQALKEGYLNQAANHPDPNARAAYQYAIDKYAGVEPQAAAIEQTKEENVHHSEQTEQEAVKPKGAENEQVESQTGNTETGEAQQTPVTEQAEPQKSEIEKTQEEPGKESTPEPAQTETATGQGKSIAASLKPESIYTDEVQQQLDQLDAEHKEYRQREEDRTNRNQSYREQANKNIKGHGMETAARKREIIQGDSLESIPGGLTDKELKARIERENSNYTGKKVTVKGKEGKVTRVAFGKVGVQFEDGSNAFFNPDDIKAVPKEKGKSTLREKTSEPASKKNTVDPEALSAIYPEQPYPKEGVLSKTTSQGTESREHFLEAQARKGGTFFHPDELEKIPGGVEAFNNLSDKGKATVQEMADAIHNDKKVYSSFYQTKTPTETGVLTKRSGYKDELYTPKGLMLNKKGKLMIAGVNENSEWSTRDPEQFTGKVEKTTETRYKGLYAHPSEIGEGENFHPNEAVVEQLVNPLQKKQHLGQKVTDADYANVVKNAKVLFAQMQPEYRTKENLEAILEKMPEPVKEYMLKNKKGPC